MKTYGIDIRKVTPFKKRGKNFYMKGFSASQFRVMEQTSGKPELVTPDYIEYLIEKYNLKRDQIRRDIKKLKKLNRLIRDYYE